MSGGSSGGLDPSVFTQPGYRCRLEWGRDGARRGALQGDILVIVDTLSFSTAVATAVEAGAIVFPCAFNESLHDLAARMGAEAAVHRRDVPARGRYSLSPLTFLDAPSGTRVALDSPNGATCSRYASDVPYLFVGAPVNASAVGRVLSRIMESSGLSVTVVACGERWEEPGEDGALRFALEDYLGAGAIIAAIDGTKSPEAMVCQSAFLATRGRFQETLLECGSGRELEAKGYREDVLHAARLDLYDSVPVMRDGGIVRMDG